MIKISHTHAIILANGIVMLALVACSKHDERQAYEQKKAEMEKNLVIAGQEAVNQKQKEVMEAQRQADLQASQPVAPTQSTIHDDWLDRGMWKDDRTGLIWTRCSVGQKWENNSCTGTPIELTWQEAQEAGRNVDLGGYLDWRLPTIEELGNIRACPAGWGEVKETVMIVPTNGNVRQARATAVPRECANPYAPAGISYNNKGKPYLDTKIFLDIGKNQTYWSSTPATESGNFAWYVSFVGGYIHNDYSVNKRFVFLVRKA